jgi:hypothetical protein
MEDSAGSAQTKKAPGKGMQLGKPKKQNELMKDLQKEKLFSQLNLKMLSYLNLRKLRQNLQHSILF